MLRSAATYHNGSKKVADPSKKKTWKGESIVSQDFLDQNNLSIGSICLREMCDTTCLKTLVF